MNKTRVLAQLRFYEHSYEHSSLICQSRRGEDIKGIYKYYIVIINRGEGRGRGEGWGMEREGWEHQHILADNPNVVVRQQIISGSCFSS